jgi:BNR repeat-containing family member
MHKYPKPRRHAAYALPGVLALTASLAWGQSVDYFTDNGFGNPLSTLQHPTAETFNGTTYVSYQGPHEDTYVCAYDQAAGKWVGPVLAGVNPMGDKSAGLDNSDVDNHGKPALIVDRKGYIHVIFGAHGGSAMLGHNAFGTPGGGKMTHAVSKKPGDISAWEILDNISPFGTYTQFVKMDDGTLYLFYRHGSHRSDWVYQKSSDDGRTFTPEVSVLKHKVQAGNAHVHDSWYAWFAKGRGNTITAISSYHPCGDSPAHSNGRYNAYYMTLNCADGIWTNAAGARLEVSVTKEYADQKTLIVNSGITRTDRGACRVDVEGNPHLFFKYGGELRYYQWTGQTWTASGAITKGDGDLIVDSPKATRLLLGSRSGTTAEVGWWKTADGGLTWAKGAVLLSRASPAGDGFEIGALLENYGAGGLVIAAERVSPTNLYRKMILLGANGPVTRPEEEASQIKVLLASAEKAGVNSTDAWDAKRKKKEAQGKISVVSPTP